MPKLVYFDGQVPKVSSWVTLATSGAGVVCHMSGKEGGCRVYLLKGLVTLLALFRGRLQRLPFEGSDNPVYLAEGEVAEITFWRAW